MDQLDEIISGYINVKFTPRMCDLLRRFFEVYYKFDYHYLDDRYVDLVMSTDKYDPETISTLFIGQVRSDLVELIQLHGIEVLVENEPDLEVLVQIAEKLQLLTSLEDYSHIYRRINTTLEPRTITVELLSSLTGRDEAIIMTSVGQVKPIFISLLKELCEDNLTEEDEVVIDIDHKKHIDRFIRFTGDEINAAKVYLDKGYPYSLTLKELLDIETTNMFDHVEQTIDKNAAQVALIILGTLIYTRDNYQSPIAKFEENSSLFTDDNRTKLRLKDIIIKMVGDFNMFVEADKRREVLNAN